jgi:hypothetical protein
VVMDWEGVVMVEEVGKVRSREAGVAESVTF